MSHQIIGQYAQTVVQTSRNHPCGRRHRQPACWTCRPSLCPRAGLESVQFRVPAPRDSWTPLHSSDRIPPLAGHQITDFWQGLALDGCLASGREARIRAIWALFIDLRGTSCVTSFCTITNWSPLFFATHPQSAIRPNLDEAHNTSVKRRSHETTALRNRRCNHTSWDCKTAGQKQLPHVP